MTNTPLQDNNPSALAAIHAWAVKSNLPEWQMDALRRLITQDKITTVDLHELEQIARNTHGLLPNGATIPQTEPLESKHIPPATGTGSGVNLVSISELKQVNRLPSDQTLSFDAQNGLNIIYGNNGSGKTGYTRVIKNACRTRGQTPKIVADVFATPHTTAASAKIEFLVEGTSSVVEWKDDHTPEPVLSQIFVFDTSSASHYLSHDDSTSFTPFGLDVLPKLAGLCDNIASSIQASNKDIDESITKHKTTWPQPNTEIHRKLALINGAT